MLNRTKADLQTEIDRLQGELNKSNDQRYAVKAAVEKHVKGISTLRHRLLDQEREISRIRGYLDRVKEEEAIRLAPKSEFEAWQRDRTSGQMVTSDNFSSDPWGHLKSGNPDEWIDL